MKSVSRGDGGTGPAKAGTVLSVVSAGGGAGKSTLSVAMALTCRKRGLTTLLLDGDCQFGDAQRMAADAKAISLEELRCLEAADLADFENDGSGLVIAGPDAMEYAEHWTPLLPQLAERASHLFDAVVVNTSGVWTEPLLALMERSHRVLFAVGQSASSVLGARRALDLCIRCGVATGSFLFLLNRCTRRSLFTSIDVSCALGGAHVLEVQEGGAVVEELQGCGLAERLLSDGNPLYKSLEAVMAEVLPSDPAPKGAASSKAMRSAPFALERRLLGSRRRKGVGGKTGKHQAAASVEREELIWR